MRKGIKTLLWLTLWALLPAAMAGRGRPSFEESQRLEAEGFVRLAFSGLQGVLLPHNDVGAITSELASKAVLDAMAQVLSLERSSFDAFEFRGFAASDKTIQFLQAEIWGNLAGTTTAEARRISNQVARYVNLRWDGHTAKYALESLREPPRSKSRPRSPRDSVLAANPDVPATWLVAVTNNVQIVRVPAARLFCPGVVAKPGEIVDLTVTNHWFKVIDGPLTWHYVSRGNGTSWTELKTDSQEDDPAKAEMFRQTRIEVRAWMDAKGIKGLGSVHSYWGEMRRILKEKHGIEWKSPSELSPFTIID